MIQRIVLPIDGSELSNKAVTYAAAMAKENGAQIKVVHVVQDIETFLAVGEAALSVGELVASMEKEGQALLDRTLVDLKGLNVKADATLLHGSPGEAICDFAKDEKADMIVIGSQGHGALHDLFLGSVSHRVTQISHCPVLIVK